MTEHGRVLAVNRVRLGSELIGDHAAGETVLHVDDGADFDEDGGWAHLGDQPVRYDLADHNDDDTADLVLAGPLAMAADDGDPVGLWDASRQVQASEVYAEVELDGEAGGDTIKAMVAHHLVDELPEGIRDLVGESVLLEEDGDDWRVVDVLGISDAAGPKWETDDSYTLTADDVADGTVTAPLSHSRIVAESLQAFWGPLKLDPAGWTVDLDAGTWTRELTEWEKAGHEYGFHYQHMQGAPRQPRAVEPLLVGATKLQTNSGGGTISSIALPAGTQPGDLLVLALTSGDTATASCADARMTSLIDWAVVGGADSGVWIGYATEDTTAVTVDLTGSWSLASLAAFRGADDLVLAYSPADVTPGPVVGSTTDPLPAVPPGLSGGLCVFLARGTNPHEYRDWNKAPSWANQFAPHTSSRFSHEIAVSTSSPTPAETTPMTAATTGFYWWAVTIGLELAP